VHPFPTPRAIASRAYRGRDKCAYCRRCGMYGCPVGAKGSTLATLLPMAVSTGRCEVRARAMATEVAVDERGRARAVIYRDAEGKSHRVEARCIVVACSAIESARLLLSSQSKRFPRGLANGSGLVGKNLLFDAGTAGLARFGVASRPWLRGRVSPFVQRAVQDFYELAEPRGGVKKGGTLHFLLAHANPIAAVERVVWADPDRPLWGRALKERLRAELQQSVTLQFEVFSEFYANDKTYVDLDPEVRDRFGQPVARITLQRHPLTQRTARLLGDEGVRILKALGPDEAPHQYPVGEGMFLQGGTCRFGTDPAASVLDRDCRAHEVPNLYVTDGSFLPTTGGAPPTMTIMANALRVAAAIAERLQSRAL
jgi:choline dehydrogenase-like flavoprotein